MAYKLLNVKTIRKVAQSRIKMVKTRIKVAKIYHS